MTDEEHADKVADAINTLLEDLEQDIIAEMLPPLEKPTKAQIAWNQALDWVTDRLKTYQVK